MDWHVFQNTNEDLRIDVETTVCEDLFALENDYFHDINSSTNLKSSCDEICGQGKGKLSRISTTKRRSAVLPLAFPHVPEFEENPALMYYLAIVQSRLLENQRTLIGQFLAAVEWNSPNFLKSFAEHGEVDIVSQFDKWGILQEGTVDRTEEKTHSDDILQSLRGDHEGRDIPCRTRSNVHLAIFISPAVLNESSIIVEDNTVILFNIPIAGVCLLENEWATCWQ